MTSTFASKTLALLIGTSVGSLGFFVLRPQDTPPLAPTAAFLWRQSRIEAIRPEAQRHRERIRAGQVGDLPTWCGTYMHSNDFESHNLDLGLDGFFYERWSCTGTEVLAYGTIAGVDGARVRLEFTERASLGEASARQGRRDFRLSDDLYVIPWADQRFVIPAELMEEFCALADATGWDRMDLADYPHAVETGAVAANTPWPLAGMPEVPERFRRFLPE